MITLLTRQHLANIAASRWAAHYGKPSSVRLLWNGIGPSTIHSRLAALGPTPDPDEVDRVIGNKSWTSILCCACDKNTDRAACIDRYDGPDLLICGACLKEAAEVYSSPPAPRPDRSPSDE